MRKDDVENIIVTGKSGAGKQPRIDVLVKEFGLEQLSTGNIFREYLGKFRRSGSKGGTDRFWREGAFLPDEVVRKTLEEEGVSGDLDDIVLGMKADHFVSSGKFVPDPITNELFTGYFSRMRFKGAVLDGYPRTVDQGRHLLDLVKGKGTRIDLVLIVDNDDDAIIGRTTGRRICPNKECGKVYHLEYKPPKDGRFCTQCGAEVVQRSDDTEDKIRSRLREFEEKCRPAIDTLKAAGIPVVTVPGNLPVFTDEAVEKSVKDAIAPLFK